MSEEKNYYLKALREYSLYILIFLSIVVLTFTILGPQVGNFSENRARFEEIRAKLENMETKIKILEGLNRNTIKNELLRLNQALPSQKDPGTMLAALDFVAARSGTRLGSFSIAVGKIEDSTISAALTVPTKLGVPQLSVNVTLRGSLANIQRFIEEVNSVLPAMGVGKVLYTTSGTSVTLDFYFKPILATRPALDSPLPAVTSKQKIYDFVLRREALPVVPEVAATTSGRRTDPFR